MLADEKKPLTRSGFVSRKALDGLLISTVKPCRDKPPCTLAGVSGRRQVLARLVPMLQERLLERLRPQPVPPLGLLLAQERLAP